MENVNVIQPKFTEKQQEKTFEFSEKQRLSILELQKKLSCTNIIETISKDFSSIVI